MSNKHSNYVAVIVSREERSAHGLFPTELLFPFDPDDAASVAKAERGALDMARRFDVAALALYAPCELIDYPIVGDL